MFSFGVAARDLKQGNLLEKTMKPGKGACTALVHPKHLELMLVFWSTHCPHFDHCFFSAIHAESIPKLIASISCWVCQRNSTVNHDPPNQWSKEEEPWLNQRLPALQINRCYATLIRSKLDLVEHNPPWSLMQKLHQAALRFSLVQSCQHQASLKMRKQECRLLCSGNGQHKVTVELTKWIGLFTEGSTQQDLPIVCSTSSGRGLRLRASHWS